VTLEDIAEAGHAPVLPLWDGVNWLEPTEAERAAFELGKKLATDSIVVAMLRLCVLDFQQEPPR
jgi:hypothetical protein